MALNISAEEAAAAAARKTVPVTEKQPATLEVQTPAAPPAAQPAKPGPGAELQKKIQELEKQNAELLKGDKAKDKAIEDLKRGQEAPQAPDRPGKPDEDPDALDVLEQSITKNILAALSSRADQKVADTEARLKPLLEEGQAAHKQREEQSAIDIFGQEAFDKYKDAAYAEQEENSKLSLVKAFQIAVPRNEEIQTAPKTEVEGARGPAPEAGRTAGDVYAEQLASARALKTSGHHSKADAGFTEAVKTRASGFLKAMQDRGG